MEQAKAAIRDFTSRGGHHDTTVEETVNPAVAQERIQQQELQESTTVVDKEVHQHHHHTTVLPVKHKEILPEQHSHNLVDVEHREYRHGDHEGIKERLAQEAAQFKNTRTTAETVHEQTVAPTVGGEHVHHHVHETVQPVIQKDIVQPVVVHTTAPVHETHHHAPTHHGATALPAMTMQEFTSRGGTLEGCEPKIDRYEGVVPIDEAVKRSTHGFHHHNDGTHDSGNITGTNGTNHSLTGRNGVAENDTNAYNDDRTTGVDGSSNRRELAGGNRNAYDDSTTVGTNALAPEGVGRNGATSGIDSDVTKKPSLLDRLNPRKDADGDGKRGIMS